MKEGLRQVNKIQTGLTLSLFKFNHYWVHGKDSEYIYHHRLVNLIGYTVRYLYNTTSNSFDYRSFICLNISKKICMWMIR